MKTIFIDNTDSTNDYLMRAYNGKDMAVIAQFQTGGKGTKGRSFSSERGGVYLSFVRHHKNLPAANAFEVMINCAVAVCKTVESFGATPVIRWANDVLVNGKKISGTLIENVLSGGYIARSVVGIGVNINNPLPPELEASATSLKLIFGRNMPQRTATRRLLKYLKKSYTIDDYKSYINWLGKEVVLKFPDKELTAVALDIDKTGNLICRADGKEISVSCAEVSLRL